MADNFSIECMHIDYIPFHVYQELKILYVLEGSIKLTAISGSIVLEKHNIDVININEPIEVQGLSKDNKILILTINRSFCESYYPDINHITFNCNFAYFYPGKPTNKVKKNFIKQVIEIAIDDISNKKSPEVIDKQLMNLLQFMIVKLDDLRLAFQSDNAVHDHFYRFQRIITHMIADSYTKFSLQDIAKQEYLDYHYLSHEFSIKLNNSFYKNLHYYRIINSVRLLLNSELSIRDISITTGFSATRYFYKLFKKYLNCTPAAFRKKHKDTVKQVTILSKANLIEILNQKMGIIQSLDLINLATDSYSTTPEIPTLSDLVKSERTTIGQDSFVDAINFIKTYMNNEKSPLTLHDCKSKELFYGGYGLKTFNNLNKPIFYVYDFINQLGRKLYYKDENFMVTMNGSSFAILAFNPSSMYPFKQNLHLSLPANSYRLTRSFLSPNFHDVKKHWINMGSPKHLDLHTIDMLNRNTYPKITYSVVEQNELTLEFYLHPYECELIILELIE